VPDGEPARTWMTKSVSLRPSHSQAKKPQVQLTLTAIAVGPFSTNAA
jgi:hypothetical protein